jgi:arsenate reductase
MPLNNGVLFVCSHNSARSQMAHGWLKHFAGDRFAVYSAGVDPGTLHPLAVRAMAEVGVDIAGHQADGIERYLGRVPIYHLVIVCDQAAQTCPRIWPGARERHEWFFEDPSSATGSDEQRLAVFRRVRDQIRAKVQTWLAEQPEPAAGTGVGSGGSGGSGDSGDSGGVG